MSEAVILTLFLMIVNFSIEGSGGYGYLLEPLWWIGMFTSKGYFFSYRQNKCYFCTSHTNVLIFSVVIGEFANFVAFMYAPAVLVTPLGAFSIIVRYSCLSFNPFIPSSPDFLVSTK